MMDNTYLHIITHFLTGVFFGGLCIGMAGVASLMGSVLQVNIHFLYYSTTICWSLELHAVWPYVSTVLYIQAALSLFGLISGPLLGLYLLGMLFRTTNSAVSIFYRQNCHKLRKQTVTTTTKNTHSGNTSLSRFIWQGGLSGMIIGLAVTLWVWIGSQIYPPTSEMTNPLSLTTVGCTNYTTPAPSTSPVTLHTPPR